MTTKHQDPPAKKRCRKVAQQQRVDAANGTPDAHGGRIETCHLVMNTIWFLLIMLEPTLMQFYITDEGLKLAQRFVHDREGIGRDIMAILSSHRIGATGTSERGVAATYHSEERQKCMQKLLGALKGHDARCYNGLTVLELERALLCLGRTPVPRIQEPGAHGRRDSGGLLLRRPARAERDGGRVCDART